MTRLQSKEFDLAVTIAGKTLKVLSVQFQANTSGYRFAINIALQRGSSFKIRFGEHAVIYINNEVAGVGWVTGVVPSAGNGLYSYTIIIAGILTMGDTLNLISSASAIISKDVMKAIVSTNSATLKVKGAIQQTSILSEQYNKINSGSGTESDVSNFVTSTTNAALNMLALKNVAPLQLGNNKVNLTPEQNRIFNMVKNKFSANITPYLEKLKPSGKVMSETTWATKLWAKLVLDMVNVTGPPKPLVQYLKEILSAFGVHFAPIASTGDVLLYRVTPVIEDPPAYNVIGDMYSSANTTYTEQGLVTNVIVYTAITQAIQAPQTIKPSPSSRPATVPQSAMTSIKAASSNLLSNPGAISAMPITRFYPVSITEAVVAGVEEDESNIKKILTAIANSKLMSEMFRGIVINVSSTFPLFNVIPGLPGSVYFGAPSALSESGVMGTFYGIVTSVSGNVSRNSCSFNVTLDYARPEYMNNTVASAINENVLAHVFTLKSIKEANSFAVSKANNVTKALW